MAFRLRVDRSMMDAAADEIRSVGRDFGGSKTYIIGTDVPYASYWIEEGYRDDPRYGTVYISYHAPPAGGARFLQAGADMLDGYVEEYEYVIGARMEGWMQSAANAAAREMRHTLAENVYAWEPYNPSSGKRWRRTHHLYNNIRAYRIE